MTTVVRRQRLRWQAGHENHGHGSRYQGLLEGALSVFMVITRLKNLVATVVWMRGSSVA